MDKPQTVIPDKATEAAPALRALLREWGPTVVWLGVVALVVVGVYGYRSHKRRRAEQASEILLTASHVRHLETILSQYSGTPAGQVALLSLAKAQYDAADYVQAHSTYARFAGTYPTHPMRPVADLGKVHCTEAMGRTAEALTEYSAFASNHPGDVLEPLARFGQARCLEELGRADEARAIYEECIAAHPDTVWQAEAEQALTALKRRMRKPSVRL